MEQSLVCNVRKNCVDWSDEKYCLNTKLYCRNDECVERSKVNDGKVDMTAVAKLTGGKGGWPPPLAGHFEVFGPPVTTLLILLSDL